MTTTAAALFHLDHAGSRFELSAHRDGLRTTATVFRDGRRVAAGSGLGPVLVPLGPDGGGGGGSDSDSDSDSDSEVLRVPTVLVLSVLPGSVHRALLLVPRPPAAEPDGGDGSAEPDAAEPQRRGRRAGAPPAELVAALPKPLARFAAADRHPFVPPPGSLAARLLVVEREHPGLWASRHVVLGVGKVAVALLGLAAFVRLLVQPVIAWLAGLLPDIDWPTIPWPDIDLPAIPLPDIDLPDIDLPDLFLPVWLQVVVVTAKFWGPILVGIGLAVVEVRRRRRAAAREDGEGGADG